MKKFLVKEKRNTHLSSFVVSIRHPISPIQPLQSPPRATVNDQLMTVCGAARNLCGHCYKLLVTISRLETRPTVTILIGIHQGLLN